MPVRELRIYGLLFFLSIPLSPCVSDTLAVDLVPVLELIKSEFGFNWE
jgi:hypothetical protein